MENKKINPFSLDEGTRVRRDAPGGSCHRDRVQLGEGSRAVRHLMVSGHLGIQDGLSALPGTAGMCQEWQHQSCLAQLSRDTAWEQGASLPHPCQLLHRSLSRALLS